jgi:hypothetical protein
MARMAGVAVILAAAAASILFGLSLGLRGLVGTVLASYVAWAANVALVTDVLSPFRLVTRGFVTVAEALLLVAAGVVWLGLGRPRPSLAPARAGVGEIARDPVTLLFVVAIAVLLGYELLLGLTSPPNDPDSVGYHLTRVLAWYHHHGLYWVPNAPTGRINAFQPLAEQQILFLFLATHGVRLYALPQYLAQLAVLVAIYGSARRLGYRIRPSACAACLFATFGIVALETTTALNDIVATAFPVVTLYFLLGDTRREKILGGIAAGIGLGVKLTTIFTWPILIAVGLLRGRRTIVQATIGVLIGFVAIGSWTFILNLAETGHLPGDGGGTTDVSASPSWPGSLVTFLSILYTSMDLGALWPVPIIALTVVGAVAAIAAGIGPLRRGRPGAALLESTQVGLPFASAGLVILGGAVLAIATRALGSPVRGPGGSFSHLGFFGGLNNLPDVNEAFFGPVGAVVIVGAPILAAVLLWRRRAGPIEVALALAFPVFLILFAPVTKFYGGYGRFLMIPAALTAPLLACLFRGRAASLAYVVVSVFVVGLAITRFDELRLFSSHGPPWHLTQAAALEEAGQPGEAEGLTAYNAAVPGSARVGAILAEGDPAFVLGDGLSHALVYLPQTGAVRAATKDGLRYVLITDQTSRRIAAAQFRRAGWTLRSLAGYWLLAERPRSRR